MGNQVNNSKKDTFTPKKAKSFLQVRECEIEEGRARSKSTTKEGLYAQDKLFENYENTSIFGFRLDTDPEEREYYINCPFCNRLNLDQGLSKTLQCKNCVKIFDVDEVLSEQTTNLAESNKKVNPNLKFVKNKKSKVHELSSLVVITDRDTLFDTFLQEEGINYDLLMKKILLPYFKMKSRIVKRGMYFTIGEIGFKVIGATPYKKGAITSKTYIHCDSFYSLKTPIKRALMITTAKLANFNQETLRKEILANDIQELLINKNEVAQIRHYQFFIRNCEPSTGVLNNDTIINIENKDLMNISKIKIAVIKFQNPIERRNYEDYILKEYFRPYFLSGVKKYVERGDIFAIEDLEMFVLNSYPENGFITNETGVMFKLGLNKEKCLEKINSADDKYANNLTSAEQTEDRIRSESFDSILSDAGRRHSERIRIFDEIIMRGLITSTRLTFNHNRINSLLGGNRFRNDDIEEDYAKNLPTLKVNSDYLKNLEEKSEEEVIKNCVICMDAFVMNDELKTLPCFHIFHSKCIDEWLSSTDQCPVCKHEVCD